MAEQQTEFDAARYKNAQREQWNKDGAAWRRWSPTLDRWYGDMTRQMLDLARIQPGQRILDIAAGAGEPAVSAAERVGPGGYVLATDISEGIVELALQVARERGLQQIETRAMDGEKLDLPDASFDAVLCRLGLMYMPHPVTAFAQVDRELHLHVARGVVGHRVVGLVDLGQQAQAEALYVAIGLDARLVLVEAHVGIDAGHADVDAGLARPVAGIGLDEPRLV